MKKNGSRLFVLFSALVSVACLGQSAFAQYEPPADYYDGVTGTGTTLKSQLMSAMSDGHIQRSYGDFRFAAAITDQDLNNSSNIITVYSGQSIDSDWDSAATWNREHVWPVSFQPGSANNGSTGNLGDPHALRPTITQNNSDRGNMPFGFGSTTGSFGAVSGFWFPGDTGRGDIARSLFYSATRWSGLTLVNGSPSGNQMGDLASLVQWHFLDPPDEFERRRNHAIFSSNLNPNYYTNNRNAYVDRPELMWSVFVDQQNDSTITVAGGNSSANGFSSLTIDLGSTIVNNAIDVTQSITLNKSGNDGTYFAIELTGDAQSDVTGRHNAMRTGGSDSVTFDVGVAYSPNQVGEYQGLVTIDNLDVTTQGGVGNGANDEDDFVSVSLKVVEHSNPSLQPAANTDFLTIDLGELVVDQPIDPVSFELYNYSPTGSEDLTAAMDLDQITSLPLNSFLSVSGQFNDLPANESETLTIAGTPDTLGIGSVFFILETSDEDIPGATTQTAQLTVTYEVVSGFLLGDVNQDGAVDFQDISPFVSLLSSGAFQLEADINGDGIVDFLDIAPFIQVLSSP